MEPLEYMVRLQEQQQLWLTGGIKRQPEQEKAGVAFRLVGLDCVHRYGR